MKTYKTLLFGKALELPDEQARSAKALVLASWAYLIGIVVVFAARIMPWVETGATGPLPMTIPHIVVAFLMNMIVIVLSRTRYYCVGSWIFVVKISLGVFVSMIRIGAKDTILIAPDYLVIANLIAALTLGFTHAIVVGIVNIVSLILVTSLSSSPIQESIHSILLVSSTFLFTTALTFYQRLSLSLSQAEKVKLRQILDVSPLMVFLKDLRLRFVEVNDLMAKSVGVDVSSLLGKSKSDLAGTLPITVEYVDATTGTAVKIDDIDRHCLDQRRTTQYLLRTDSPHSQRFIQTTRAPLLDSNKNLVGIVGFNQDVTELVKFRKQAEAEHVRFMTVAKNSPGVIFQFIERKLPTPKLVFLSGAASQMFEWAEVEREATFEKLIALVHPLDFPNFNIALDFAFESRAQWVWVGRLLLPSGNVKWIQMSCNPMVLDDVVNWYGIIVDVTAQKEAEELIAAQRNTLSSLLSALPDRVFIINCDLDVFSLSDSLDVQDVHQHYGSLGTIFPSDVFKDVHCSVTDAIHKSKCTKLEFVTNENGSDKTFEARFSQIDTSQCLCIIREITEQKKQEATLVATSKMAALGEMSGGIAHEINNPLTIILGNALLLKRYMAAENKDYAKLSQTAETIHSMCNRIAKIITGLRTFARDGENDPVTVSTIQDIIEDTLALCEARFLHQRVSLEKNIPSERVSLQCRSIQISQVLLNLLNNAFDAVSQTSNPTVTLSLNSTKTDVTISVTDNGPGMPPHIADKVMRPFFTTKEAGKGTGLGLSISKGIVDAHNGKLFFSTSPKGTTFSIQLPLQQS